MDLGWGSYFTSFLLVPLIVLLVFIALGVVFARRTLANGTATLTPRRLVEGYLFTILLVAMLLVSGGITAIVKSGISRYAGLESTYRPRPVFQESGKPEDVKYEYDQRAPFRDLLQGSALLGVGLLVGLSHLWGLRRLNRTELVVASPLYRLFLIVGLIIYTAATLAYAVGAVSDFLVFRYAGSPPPREFYDRPLPGHQIAGLIGFLPLWAMLVIRLFRFAQPRSG